MLSFEMVIEFFGNPLNVKTCPNPTRYIKQCKLPFLLETKGNGFKFLDQ